MVFRDAKTNPYGHEDANFSIGANISKREHRITRLLRWQKDDRVLYELPMRWRRCKHYTKIKLFNSRIGCPDSDYTALIVSFDDFIRRIQSVVDFSMVSGKVVHEMVDRSITGYLLKRHHTLNTVWSQMNVKFVKQFFQQSFSP